MSLNLIIKSKGARIKRRRKRKPYAGYGAGVFLKRYARSKRPKRTKRTKCTTCGNCCDFVKGTRRCADCRKCKDCGSAVEGSKWLCFSCKKKRHKRHKRQPNHYRRAGKLGVKRESFQLKLIRTIFDMKCDECGFKCNNDNKSMNRAEVDHIIPWSKMKAYGVGHEMKNVRLLCRKCNLKKSDKLPQGSFRSAYDVVNGYPSRPLVVKMGNMGDMP